MNLLRTISVQELYVNTLSVTYGTLHSPIYSLGEGGRFQFPTPVTTMLHNFLVAINIAFSYPTRLFTPSMDMLLDLSAC